MTIETLQRLSKNPNYKLSPAEVKLLEAHRDKQLLEKVQQDSTQNVVHDTTVQKHNTDLPEEQRKGRG